MEEVIKVEQQRFNWPLWIGVITTVIILVMVILPWK